MNSVRLNFCLLLFLCISIKGSRQTQWKFMKNSIDKAKTSPQNPQVFPELKPSSSVDAYNSKQVIFEWRHGVRIYWLKLKFEDLIVEIKNWVIQKCLPSPAYGFHVTFDEETKLFSLISILDINLIETFRYEEKFVYMIGCPYIYLTVAKEDFEIKEVRDLFDFLFNGIYIKPKNLDKQIRIPVQLDNRVEIPSVMFLTIQEKKDLLLEEVEIYFWQKGIRAVFFPDDKIIESVKDLEIRRESYGHSYHAEMIPLARQIFLKHQNISFRTAQNMSFNI